VAVSRGILISLSGAHRACDPKVTTPYKGGAHAVGPMTVPLAGGLSPVAQLVHRVIQWSAEPNSPVTQWSRWRFPSTPCLKPVSWGAVSGGSSSRAAAVGCCCSLRDGNHSLIHRIWYCDSVFGFDLLIYPARRFRRRFGMVELVVEKIFSAKFIYMAKWGVCHDFDSRPYKKW
jgi:hypothetical protein